GAGDVLAVSGALPSGITSATYDGAGVLTITGAASLASYEAVFEQVTFSSTSDNPTNFDANLSRSLSWVVNDGQVDSTAVTTSVTVVAVNDPPVVDLNGAGAGTGAPLSYTENQAATAIAPGAVVTDADSADFNGGSLTVSFGATGHAEDQLTIQNQGTGAGQVGVSGGNVTFGGVTIGT